MFQFLSKVLAELDRPQPSTTPTGAAVIAETAAPQAASEAEGRQEFQLQECRFYSHPEVPGLRLLAVLDPSGMFADVEKMHVCGVKVTLPIGGQDLIYPFRAMGRKKWVTLRDPDRQDLPLQIYVAGSTRVLARWL
jgi:hypothetical protein